MVDFTVKDLVYNLPKNDAVTAYAFGPGGGTRTYTGPLQAAFKHYNDGRWILVSVTGSGLNLTVDDTTASSSDEGNQGDCKVILANQSATVASPYTGGCQNGLAEGQGSFSMKEGADLSSVKGQFHNGRLNGNVTITSSGNLIRTGEYRDGLPWNAIFRGVTAKGVTFAVQYRGGAIYATCRTDGQGEKNCTDRQGLLGVNSR
jgi:hypothetical protein